MGSTQPAASPHWEDTVSTVTDAAVCRLEPVNTDADLFPPRVYVALLPEEGEHEDSEDVVGFLVTESIHQRKAVQLMGGLTLERADAEGFYIRKFDSFADMASTLVQGL